MTRYSSKDAELNRRLQRGYKFIDRQETKFKDQTSYEQTFIDYIMGNYYLDKILEEIKTWPSDQEYSSWFVSAARDSCTDLVTRASKDLPHNLAKGIIRALKNKISNTQCDISIKGSSFVMEAAA